MLTDPNTRDWAVTEINAVVGNTVESAIMSKLTWVDKLTLDFDDKIGADTAVSTSLPGPGAPSPLSLTFGQQPGGRLLFYRDQNQDGTGHVGAPAVIGLNGWADHQFLFSGGNGIIYAVDQLIPNSSRYEIDAHSSSRHRPSSSRPPRSSSDR